jgi:hypothetical protein
MNFSSDNNILTIGRKRVEFPFKISHAEKFGEVIIVITDYYESNINENVWGVNKQGAKIWQIPKIKTIEYEGIEYSGISDPYTGIHKIDEQTARLFNWEGGYFEIDSLTGEFTKNIIEFRKGRRAW